MAPDDDDDDKKKNIEESSFAMQNDFWAQIVFKDEIFVSGRSNLV